MHIALRFGISALLATMATLASHAQMPKVEKTRDNLMVVVRESIGGNRLDDVFVPTGKLKMRSADGREVELELAYWYFIGDTLIRFVFDGPQSMANATPQDLVQLGVNDVDEALALAILNIKRVYGEPSATPWEGGLMQVKGKSPDLDSSYFLDRSYWRTLLKKHPEGLVVAVPKRGGLLYVPLSNGPAVERLKLGVARLHASSDRMRVSSALFLFKDDKWSVLQAPVKQ
jgi:hypothetical protein